MKKERAILLLLILSILVSFPKINIVMAWTGVVYIRADGSVDPPTAPIQRNGDLYTLTGNISSDTAGIIIERNNIIVDGAGYTIQFFGVSSSSDQAGIILTDRSQVTVKNVNIKEFVRGMQVYRSISLNIYGNNLISNLDSVYLWDSHDSTISENNLTEKKGSGIHLDDSSNNNITGNNIVNSTRGLMLRLGSSNNRVLGNTFTNAGLYVSDSYENIVEGNTVNGRPLVYLEGASDRAVDNAGQVILVNCYGIKVENLSISNTTYGLQLLSTNNSIIANNYLAGNTGGICLRGSSNNSIVRNKLVAGTDDGISAIVSSNNSIVENDVTGNGMGVGLWGSQGNSVTENNITASGWSGLYISSSNYNRVFRNNLVDNNYGIQFGSSQGNNVYENNITLNHEYGIYLDQSSNNEIYHNKFVNNTNQVFVSQSSNNKFYHNNFMAGTNRVFASSSVNVWDDGYFSGGNYWSDYSVADEKSGPSQDQPGSDGIGDTPRNLGDYNSDQYPLVDIYSMIPAYPIASFAHSPGDPIAGQTVIFNASESTCQNGTITTYYWSFGDGAFSGGSVATHEYASYGNYNITLTAISNSRSLSNQTRLINVREKPTANFQHFPTFNLSVGQAITFNASLSNPRGGSITGYIWNFGDENTTSTGQPIVILTYAQPETYNVTLTVLDSEGLNSSQSGFVKVWMPVFLSASTSSSTVYVGFAVDINGSLSDIYGNGLENETIVLYYTFSGANTWVPITSDTTDQLGRYFVKWIPPATGSFTLKAEWRGNTTHFAASTIISISTLSYQNEYFFCVESNSTISELDFESTSSELRFIVSGPSGTTGYVDVYVAKTLIGNIAKVEVKLNGEEINYTATSLDDSWLIHFTYQHSTHSLIVSLGSISGPFTEISVEILLTMTIIPIIASGVIIVLYFWKKKQSLTVPVPKGRVRK